MKKLLVILAALYAMTDAAQENFKMVGRVGYSFDSMSGNYTSSTSGFDLGFGFNHYLSGHSAEGLFWGLEVQGSTANAHIKDLDNNNFSFGIIGEPRIGFKIPINNSTMALSPYIGLYMGYRFKSKSKIEESHPLGHTYCKYKVDKGITFGIDAGIEFYFTKCFFANLHIKKSFRDDAELSYNYKYDYVLYVDQRKGHEKFSAMKVVLGLGYEF